MNLITARRSRTTTRGRSRAASRRRSWTTSTTTALFFVWSSVISARSLFRWSLTFTTWSVSIIIPTRSIFILSRSILFSTALMFVVSTTIATAAFVFLFQLLFLLVSEISCHWIFFIAINIDLCRLGFFLWANYYKIIRIFPIFYEKCLSIPSIISGATFIFGWSSSESSSSPCFLCFLGPVCEWSTRIVRPRTYILSANWAFFVWFCLHWHHSNYQQLKWYFADPHIVEKQNL